MTDLDSDGHDDWIADFPADVVAAGTPTSAFSAALASSQRVAADPPVTFGTAADGDADGIMDSCDACPTVSGTGVLGCP